MNDFDYEVKQKKDIARSAAHKVNGVKSRKCTLPTDHMTDSQIRKMNGQEISFNINKPITLDKFKKIPSEVGREYIMHLHEMYGVGNTALAQMFLCTKEYVRQMLSADPYNIKFHRGRQMTYVQRQQWRLFLGENEETEEPATPDAANVADAWAGYKEPLMTMDSFSIRFDGTINVDAVANSLRMMLGNRTDGTIEINFQKK